MAKTRAKTSGLPALNKDELAALVEAEEVYDTGLDRGTNEGAVDGARLAAAISPLFADAYVTLAIEQSAGPVEELFYWRTALLAAEMSLGSKAMAELAGDFWGFHETRPYMRAKHGLALALWAIGERAEAVSHLWQLLELNPNDNQGARWVLLNFLLQQREDIQAAGLIHRYEEDDSADMAWGAALVAFRLRGAASAERELAAARASNPHVPAYLLGSKKLPKRMPDHYTPGSTNEAAIYVENCGEAWRATKGALRWLQSAA